MVSLTGLATETFQHPEEKVALDTLNKAKWLKELIQWSAKMEAKYHLRTNALGNCYPITPADMPELYRLTGEVCQTLDYAPVPRLFLYRACTFNVDIFDGEPDVIMIPDYVLNEFTAEMMRFKLGRCVTALKSQEAKLSLAVTAISQTVEEIPVAGDIALPLLADWSRKAKFTQDRGGLLACQDADAAYRVLLREAGMPRLYLDTSAIPQYIRTYQSGAALVHTVQYARTIKKMSPWKNDRIVELSNWIQSGQYDDIIEEYE